MLLKWTLTFSCFASPNVKSPFFTILSVPQNEKSIVRDESRLTNCQDVRIGFANPGNLQSKKKTVCMKLVCFLKLIHSADPQWSLFSHTLSVRTSPLLNISQTKNNFQVRIIVMAIWRDCESCPGDYWWHLSYFTYNDWTT